jgi:hypothetical protein
VYNDLKCLFSPKSGNKYGTIGQTFIRALKQSTTVTMATFTKLALSRQLFVQDSYTEFNDNWQMV